MYSVLWSSVVAMFTAFMVIMLLAAHGSMEKISNKLEQQRQELIDTINKGKINI